jgi:myo-inositol-1(or 4)-monophosphatase
MSGNFEEFMAAAQDAARAAGRVLVDMLDTAAVREKSPKDLVTDADVAAQKVIHQALMSRFPRHRFLGEESDTLTEAISLDQLAPEDWCWVVDPIDGTANYVHRLPNFAVSIALVRGGRSQVGVVYDPMADEMFSAIVGGGAKLNDKPIESSGCTRMSQALIAASFPPNVQRNSPEVDQFLEVLVAAQSIRRLGSAALNLCFVGCGRLDGYWAGKVQSWDIAAGALVATEGQAILTARDGSPFSLTHGDLTVAATPELHRELCSRLAAPLARA